MKKLMSRLNVKKLSKKGKIAVAAALVSVLCVAGVTMALLNRKTEAAVNYFEGAVVNVGVLEDGTIYENGNNNHDGYTRIVSGQMTEKTVAVKNIDSQEYPTTDTYVRVRLVSAFVYDDGQEYAGQIVPVNMNGSVTYTYGSSENWKYQTVNGENYYYYNKAIAPDEVTDDLITGVTYTGDVPENAHFELQVLTEGIAARQTGSLSAWGFAGDQMTGLQNLN